MRTFAYLIMTELGRIRSARRTRAGAQRYIDKRVAIGIDGSARWWIKPVREMD